MMNPAEITGICSITAPRHAHAVVGIAREFGAICQRFNIFCLYHAITGFLTTVCSFINCHFHWYHWLCSAWYIQSAIHRGILDPYWFFEDWDLSNSRQRVREFSRFNQNQMKNFLVVSLQPALNATRKLNNSHSPSKGSSELGWCSRTRWCPFSLNSRPTLGDAQSGLEKCWHEQAIPFGSLTFVNPCSIQGDRCLFIYIFTWKN